GMVGTRKNTPYGKRATLAIARCLASYGFTIISGMARGIDTTAHYAALEVGGKTVAVLGCGVDVVYPGENYSLAQEIIKKGALISEFPPGTKPSPKNFPRRNRIISGLSLGLVVIEAAERSGALITADFALEQGREVFAVPGNIDSPYSKGCHKLIKEGAVLVEDPLDVLLELGYNGAEVNGTNIPVNLTVEEKNLLEVVTEQPIHIDELLKLSSLTPSRLNSLLTGLEVKGAVKQQLGKYFVKVNRDV
ncbi:MAG: DNA-protecting protein DprA, partial [Candidatus Syntrophonatronum acetioxidans]